jgi:hypothetical protein
VRRQIGVPADAPAIALVDLIRDGLVEGGV